VTSEEFGMDKDEGWCCYCSVFGIGPAWTLYFYFSSKLIFFSFVLGFFLWIFWIVGIIYIFSWKNRVRRLGGAANLVATVVCIVYLSVLPLFLPGEAIAISNMATFLAGLAVLSLLACHQRNKLKNWRLARRQLRSHLQKKPKEFTLEPKLYSYSTVVDNQPIEDV
jgi:hypothetical protein